MKKLFLVLPLCAFMLSGCGSFIPKQVEFFQKKVKAVPVWDNTALEHQRQAAQFVAQKTQETKESAIATHADPTVIWPATEANTAAQALTEAVGPAKRPWTDSSADLAQTLHKDTAKLNEKIADYRVAVTPEVGKKIEGTGLIRVGYFTYIGCLLLLGALAWFAIKAYGMFNPIVGTAAGVVGRVSSSVASRGLSEVVTGGQQFLQWVEDSHLESEVKDWITNTFKVAHQTAQSPDVQKVVDKLVTPSTSSVSPVTLAPSPKPAA